MEFHPYLTLNFCCLPLDFYQQTLQLAVFFLQKLQEGQEAFCDEKLSPFLLECLGFSSSAELEWLSDCLSKGIQYYLDVEGQSRYLRLPLVLAEPSYLADLRRGPALRSLRRIYLLCRIGRIVEDCLDDAVAGKQILHLCFRNLYRKSLTLHSHLFCRTWVRAAGAKGLPNEQCFVHGC